MQYGQGAMWLLVIGRERYLVLYKDSLGARKLAAGPE